jgi:putative hydroxymethylpyrimidine transport system substrate-binding protein
MLTLRRFALLTVVLLTALLAAGCGSHTSSSKTRSVSLVLDFTPNAIHSGIYTAIKRGYDHAAGIDLHVIVPSASTDAIKLLETGRADFAILDIHDLAIADAQGRNLVGLMAIVERPLASVIAQARYPSPKALAGQTVGVTGDPSDLAVLRSVVSGAGGDPAKLHTVTIGYDAVQDLLAGRVAAATAFWNDEGVTLQHERPGFHVFRVEDYGAPAYPELIVTTTAAELRAHPALARGLVQALTRGYEGVLKDPSAGAAALESQVSGLSATDVHQQLAAELPSFTPPGGGAPGRLVPAVLERWASWEAKFGIVKRAPDVATMFDAGLTR